jgi:hypothetical protein
MDDPGVIYSYIKSAKLPGNLIRHVFYVSRFGDINNEWQASAPKLFDLLYGFLLEILVSTNNLSSRLSQCPREKSSEASRRAGNQTYFPL